jgi:PAS domain S-box-containing protein
MEQKSASIQQKLMRVILLTSGVVLLMTCAAFFAYEFITYRDITKRELSTLGQIVATNSTAALAFDSKEDATETLAALKAERHIVAACLYDKNGDLFATYPGHVSAKDFPSQLKTNGYVFTGGHLEGFEPVVQNGIRLGTLYLKNDLQAVYSRFRLYGVIALLFIIISFLFAYFLSRRLQKSITAPILELAGTARVISDQRDYSVRATKRNDDELGVLTDAFNHMLTEIEVQNLQITSLNQNLEQKVKERTSELEAANSVLTQQNEFIETIIDSSVDLIAVFDTEYRYVTVNRKADEIYKIKKEDLVGKKVLDIFPQIKDSDMMKDLKIAFTDKVVHNPGYKSLSGHYLENFFIPLKDKNDVVDRVLVIGHDITEIMLANEKLKVLNAELEKSNRDLEQFAYVASHDLQEPLRKIQTFAELSEKNIQHPEIQKRYLQKVNSSAHRMTDLIKAVLNYSRLSKTDSEFVAIDLNAVIETIKTDLELLIEEKKAVITTTNLPSVQGIPLQINQLFLNLLSNSLKFSEGAPDINISSSILPESEIKKIGFTKNGAEYIKLVFSDNGIGFEQQYADKIFSIFQRLHTSQYAGTGIGLALCKKIVENHGGFITVESEPEKGTSFFIYLPLMHNSNNEQTNSQDQKGIFHSVNQ